MRSILCLLGMLAFIHVSTAQINRQHTKRNNPYRDNFLRMASNSYAGQSFEIRGGTLWAYGYNSSGQLGDGTNVSKSSAVQIGTDDKWVSVSSGAGHTLGLKTDGTLWAWGSNGYGSLGDGTTTNKLTPVQIGTDNKWVYVYAGYFNSYGVKADGTLWAWGFNNMGQLGDGTTTNKLVPVKIGTDNKWSSVAASAGFALALKADGTLWVWGNLPSGLGDGTTFKLSPGQIGTDNKWTSITVGHFHMLATKSDGTLWGWGNNGDGQLGDGTKTSKSTPTQVGSATNWVGVSTGMSHTLGLQANGTLWSWGKNNFGQLGDGTTTDKTSPSQVGTETTWVKIVAGINYSMALKANGALYSWGNNQMGQLGDGTTVNKNVPAFISNAPAKSWLTIYSGTDHNLALLEDGTLWGWGDNWYNSLGISPLFTDVTKPSKIGDEDNWVSAAGGTTHSLFIRSDGSLYSIGNGADGKLGTGTTPPVTLGLLKRVGTEANWVAVAAGETHSVALKADGTLWAWGRNNEGQLGDGTTLSKSSPVKIGTDNKWMSISAKGYYTLALKSDGTLWGWGVNTGGQLGDGTTISKNVPTRIGTASNWISVSAGGKTNAAIKSDGSIWIWGYNNSYQGSAIVPTQQGSGRYFIASAAGLNHVGALETNGIIQVWGINDFGQLGYYPSLTYTSSFNYSIDGSSAKWVGVSVGSNHSIGIKSGRAQFCATGNNNHGQLGYPGSTTTSYSLVCTTTCAPPAPATVTGNITCAGSTATLIPSGDGIKKWFTTDGISATNHVYFTTPVLTENTTYILEQYTCQPTRTAVTVTVNPLPTVSANATATSVCPGEQVTLSGSGAVSYSWTNGVSDNVAFTPAAPATYIVTGTDANNCTDTESITITVKASAVISSFTPASGTERFIVTITGSGFTGATSVAFNGLPATFFLDNDNQITATVPDGATTGAISVASSSGCISNSSSNFTVYSCDGDNYVYLSRVGSTSGNTLLSGPVGIAVDGARNIYVGDGGLNVIKKFTRFGTYITHWGSSGTGNGQFNSPYGIAVDNAGYVYVADKNNHRIQKFDANGNYILQWGTYGTDAGQLRYPEHLAIDPSGYIFVADLYNHRIQKYTNTGTYLSSFGTLGSANGELDSPRGVTIDASGNIYVSEMGNYRIQKFDNNGGYITKWGTMGSGYGEFSLQSQLTVDGEGNIIVVDHQNHRIQKFTDNGQFITAFGIFGFANGELYGPWSVAADASCNLYVTDLMNNRVQVFATVNGIPKMDASFTDSEPVTETKLVLQAYPNPTSGTINVSFQGLSSYDLVLYNTMGEEILREKSESEYHCITGYDIPEGVYILQASNGEQFSKVKIVVSK